MATTAETKAVARVVTQVVTKLAQDKPNIEFFTTIVLRADERCGGQPGLLGPELYRSLILAETVAWINGMRAWVSDETAGKIAKASWDFSEAYVARVLA